MPTPADCALCTERNDRAHREIGELLNDVRAAQVAAEIQLARVAEDLEHVAGRRNGRAWWRVPVLAVALGAATGVMGWGALALVDHGSRLAVVERVVAAAPAPAAKK